VLGHGLARLLEHLGSHIQSAGAAKSILPKSRCHLRASVAYCLGLTVHLPCREISVKPPESRAHQVRARVSRTWPARRLRDSPRLFALSAAFCRKACDGKAISHIAVFWTKLGKCKKSRGKGVSHTQQPTAEWQRGRNEDQPALLRHAACAFPILRWLSPAPRDYNAGGLFPLGT
jgi:hypothetical protein